MINRIVSGVLVLILLATALALWAMKVELPKYRDAFLYSFGPYEFVRSVQDLSGQREADSDMFTAEAIQAAALNGAEGALLNREVHNSRLADHTLRSVTTPNNDTLYTSAVLELSQTPVEISVPEAGDRYLSIALMDVFTDQFAHIGPRETGGAGGTYWIVGPEDTSIAPADVKVIRATGNDVWMLARVFVSGQTDLAAAKAMQNGIRVRSVFPDREPIPFKTKVSDIADSKNFTAVVQEALARNGAHPQTQRAVDFPQLSLGEGAEYGPIDAFFWSLVTPRAEASLTAQVNDQLSAQLGWSAPPENIGIYGDDDRLRSGIALIGFGALRREDAVYYRMTRTEDGELLDGTKSYRMTLPADVPAQAFWSLSIYKPDETGRFFFFENPTGRYSLNSGSDGLMAEADGRVVLHIGPTPPPGATSNWLPTPDGAFAAFFRLYLPTDGAVQSVWMPPAMIKE